MCVCSFETEYHVGLELAMQWMGSWIFEPPGSGSLLNE